MGNALNYSYCNESNLLPLVVNTRYNSLLISYFILKVLQVMGTVKLPESMRDLVVKRRTHDH